MIKRPVFRAPGRRRGADEGATAVEFAMVAAPLFFMIFATLELALVFITSTTLENALSRGARTIRTGQQQAAAAGKSAAVSEAEFVAAVCDNMAFLKDGCTDNLFIDVRRSTTFSSVGAPDPTSSGKFDDTQLKFEPGGQSEKILVRGFYKWPLITPFLSEGLAKVDGNTAVLMATETFRNEPF